MDIIHITETILDVKNHDIEFSEKCFNKNSGKEHNPTKTHRKTVCCK